MSKKLFEFFCLMTAFGVAFIIMALANIQPTVIGGIAAIVIGVIGAFLTA